MVPCVYAVVVGGNTCPDVRETTDCEEIGPPSACSSEKNPSALEPTKVEFLCLLITFLITWSWSTAMQKSLFLL